MLHRIFTFFLEPYKLSLTLLIILVIGGLIWISFSNQEINLDPTPTTDTYWGKVDWENVDCDKMTFMSPALCWQYKMNSQKNKVNVTGIVPIVPRHTLNPIFLTPIPEIPDLETIPTLNPKWLTPIPTFPSYINPQDLKVPTLYSKPP